MVHPSPTWRTAHPGCRASLPRPARRARFGRLISGGVLAAMVLWALPTHAAPPSPTQKAPKAADERLRGLSAQTLHALAPHLAHGPVALVEFTHHPDALPAVNVAARIAAPVDAVVRALTQPEHYPDYMGTVDHVKVVSRDARTVVYDWDFRMAVFRMRGRNVMRIYPAPAGDPSRGARITVDNQSGDMGTGRTLMRVLPQPDGGSLLVISMRIDLREANYVARQVARAARSVNRTANLALSYALLLGVRERVQGTATPRVKPGALTPPQLDRRALQPLLRRGDVVLLDLWGPSPGRVTIAGLIHRGQDVVHAVMTDAEGFGSALVPGSGADVVSHSATDTVFDWELGLPLFGVSGQMTMHHAEPAAIDIRATDGALRGGQWRFEAEALGSSRSLVTGWAQFDLRRTNFLVRGLIDSDPDLHHGLSAASEVMLLRALRTRSGKQPVTAAERAPRAHARLVR